MDVSFRRKRNALISGVIWLIAGIICLVVRSVYTKSYYIGNYYYQYNYTWLLITGIVLIVLAGLQFLYALILHLRPSPPVQPATCVIIPPSQGVVGYPPPAQQYVVPATNVPYPAGPYPNQTSGVMIGNPGNYPAGTFPPQAGGYPTQAGGYPTQAGGYPTQASGYQPQASPYPPQASGYQPSANPDSQPSNYASAPDSNPPPYEGGLPAKSQPS